MTALADRGIELATVELVVGLGTFRPIAADKVEDHEMHAERYRVPSATLDACEAASARGGRVVAVGTTVVRALESAAADRRARRAHRAVHPRGLPTSPVVDRLLTNFHLPRSSLLVMIDAFVGASATAPAAGARSTTPRWPTATASCPSATRCCSTRHDRW